MGIRNYDVVAVGETLEHGKNGNVMDASVAGQFTAKDKDGNLAEMRGGAAVSPEGYITQAQFDAGIDSVRGLSGTDASYQYDATSGISQLANQGTGANGEIEQNDQFFVAVGGSFLGTYTLEAGDYIRARKRNPDVTDNTSSNTDWYVDIRRTSGDLADGVTLESANDKIQMKDGGTTTNKIADLNVTAGKMADDSVPTRTIVDRNVTGQKVAVGTLTDENHANSTITKGKLATAVQTTLTNADTAYGTRTPNLASALGGGFNSDTDNSIAANTLLTNTTVTGQLAQADTELQRITADSALRKATINYSDSSVNIGSAVPSGNTLLRGTLKTVTQGSHGTDNVAGLTLQIGVSGNLNKYADVGVFDLFDPAGAIHPFTIMTTLGSQEQLVATLTDTDGTGIAGQWEITIEQSH